MYYGIIFLLLSLIALYCFFYPETVYFKKFKALAFLLLLFTSGLRYETAVDCYTYERYFNSIDQVYKIFNYGFSGLFEKFHGEPAFTLLNSIVKTFTNDVQVLFFIISLITTTLLFKALQIFCEKKYFHLSILIYFATIFFILDMSGIRQCLALSIVLYSFKYLNEKRNTRYLLLVALASMFHFSALVFLIAPLLIAKEIKLSSLLIIMSVGICIFMFKIRWLTYSIQSLYSFFPENIVVSKIYAYTIVNAVFTRERHLYIMLFVNIFLGSIILYGRGRFWNKNIINSIFFNLLFAYFFFIFVFWEIFEIGFRFGLYFILGLVYFLPQILNYFKRNSRVFVLGFIILYCFMNVRVFVLEDKSVIPYNPYQNYIVYKALGLKSTGPQRLNEYLLEVEKKQNK